MGHLEVKFGSHANWHVVRARISASSFDATNCLANLVNFGIVPMPKTKVGMG